MLTGGAASSVSSVRARGSVLCDTEVIVPPICYRETLSSTFRV